MWVLLAGNGELREQLAQMNGPDVDVQIYADLVHEDMAPASEMDVLVLPSHTTPRWAEQFGRVLVEALWCGIPVVGSSSGEIPWGRSPAVVWFSPRATLVRLLTF